SGGKAATNRVIRIAATSSSRRSAALFVSQRRVRRAEAPRYSYRNDEFVAPKRRVIRIAATGSSQRSAALLAAMITRIATPLMDRRALRDAPEIANWQLAIGNAVIR